MGLLRGPEGLPDGLRKIGRGPVENGRPGPKVGTCSVGAAGCDDIATLAPGIDARADLAGGVAPTVTGMTEVEMPPAGRCQDGRRTCEGRLQAKPLNGLLTDDLTCILVDIEVYVG